jgi:hypothetical protein
MVAQSRSAQRRLYDDNTRALVSRFLRFAVAASNGIPQMKAKRDFSLSLEMTARNDSALLESA